MTRPIGSTRQEASSSPEPEVAAALPSPVQEAPSTNAVESWQAIEADFGRGLCPDMEAIDQRLGQLNGKDLRAVLEQLERDGALDRLINQMTPGERQELLAAAQRGNLVAREGPRGKLVAKQPLPESFRQLLADFDALGPNRKTETFYNWSANGEGAGESLQRSMHNQVRALQPGDQLKLHGGGAVSAQHKKVGVEGATIISRDPDGRFRLAMDGKGLIGGELKTPHGMPLEAKLEAGAGAGSRVEYTFATAEEAEAAAREIVANPIGAALRYGQPAAIELRGHAAVELAARAGLAQVKVFEGKLAGDATLTARLEHEQVVFKASARAEVLASLALHTDSFALEVHGLADANAQGRTELEARVPLDANGGSRLEQARFRFSTTTETSAMHHGSVSELSFEADAKQLEQFVGALNAQGFAPALRSLSRGVEVNYRKKDVELKHAGAKVEVELNGYGVEADFGYERRAFSNERTVFRGSAAELFLGERKR